MEEEEKLPPLPSKCSQSMATQTATNTAARHHQLVLMPLVGRKILPPHSQNTVISLSYTFFDVTEAHQIMKRLLTGKGTCGQNHRTSY